MLQISPEDVENRLSFDNPWWSTPPSEIDEPYAKMPERSYLEPFLTLVNDRSVRRAIILMGPRRVGKTVILQQTIQKLLQEGTPGNTIMFLSLETPIYTGVGLEKFVLLFQKKFGHGRTVPLTVIFDEIQYLSQWEVHLKSLVDSFSAVRFIASGSAAAALRLKSRESGAGRFTEFLLPPLTFAEYLRFVKKEAKLIKSAPQRRTYLTSDIHALNAEFVEYLNIGGYPEAVFNDAIRHDSGRYIKSDIVDKVLLRDLPQIYGIRDTQELNRLFTTLAYNTGNEVSLDELSKNSGVSKTTLNRYLEYLEAAFLIKRIYRIDQNARHFQRATSFKVYLTNPSMRAALFGNVDGDDKAMGALAETALFAQWFHDPVSAENIHYARWNTGEIDMVALSAQDQQPSWCVEVKWTDRPAKDWDLLRHLSYFWKKHPGIAACTTTTRTILGMAEVDGYSVRLLPTSLLVYSVGKNIFKRVADKYQKPPTPSKPPSPAP
ncbi:MAG: ATP-binding protein [Verrucomicrobiota bacterium]